MERNRSTVFGIPRTFGSCGRPHSDRNQVSMNATRWLSRSYHLVLLFFLPLLVQCQVSSLPRGTWHRVMSDLELVNHNYGEQHLNLYSFCTSFNRSQTLNEESIYMEVLGLASTLQYVAFDWSAGNPGIDFIPATSSLRQPSIIVPLQINGTSQSGWNPYHDDITEVSGLILSQWPLERVSLFFSKSTNPVSDGSCPKLEALLHPSCSHGKGRENEKQVQCSPDYVQDCSGFPAVTPCPHPLSDREDSSSSKEIPPMRPWIALVGFLPVTIISCAVFVLLRLDQAQRRNSSSLPDDGTLQAAEEFELYLIDGEQQADESDDESPLIPGDGLPV